MAEPLPGSRRLVVASLLLVVAASGAYAACGDAPGDAPAVAAARAGLAALCPCDAATRPRDYLACVKQGIALAVSAHVLPPACVRTVQDCAKRSRCGRPGMATCCRVNSAGRSKCRVTTPARCVSSGGCVGTLPSCCDACGASGCVTTTTATTTTSTTTTAVSTSTTTTTIPANCGNGTIEPALGEECDGEPFCNATCRIPAPTFCCEIDAGDGRICTETTGGGMPLPTCSGFFGPTATLHVGTTSVVTGPSCASAPFPYASFTSEGTCGAPTAFPPTTFCCGGYIFGFGCTDVTLADSAALASWMYGSCSHISMATIGYFASVGSCSLATGQCVPGH